MTNPNVRPDLRKALIETGRAVGCILSDEVSDDFLMLVPEEARQRVAGLIAHIERLQNALKPFAELIDFSEYTEIPDETYIAMMLCSYGEEISASLKMSDLRNAAKALSQGTSNE